MTKKTTSPVTVEQIDGMIRTLRGTRVILDSDLAKIYGFPTFRFNEATQSASIPARFHVPAHDGRSCGFKIANCDLKERPRPAQKVAALRVY